MYTIGHSRHSPEKFAQLLLEHNIKTLVDVRTAPYSRFCPWFNKDDLGFDLQRRQISYLFSGKLLGGRPSDPTLYKGKKLPEDNNIDYLHEVDYEEIMKRPWFNDAIDNLVLTAEQSATVIMCSEEDPADCHRHHLIAKYLLEFYPEVEVIHIRGDGTTYHAKSILKSVNKPQATQGTLF
jgi:uncharacterized protein (DUF488 family)